MINFTNLVLKVIEFDDKVAEATIKKRLNAAKYRADKKGLVFELTEEIIRDKFKKQKGLCYYSGIRLSFHCGRSNTISFERIDSSIGYTVENTVLVTKIVNNAKKDASETDFYDMIAKVYIFSPTKVEIS
jgi:hypothetical protein